MEERITCSHFNLLLKSLEEKYKYYGKNIIQFCTNSSFISTLYSIIYSPNKHMKNLRILNDANLMKSQS